MLFKSSYTQKGNCCLIASYALIYEFVRTDLTALDFLQLYCEEFKINEDEYKNNFKDNLEGLKNSLERSENIGDHYHRYCRENGDIRGIQFIKELFVHKVLGLNQFLEIRDVEYDIKPLSPEILDNFKSSLKECRFAQIVVPGHSLIIFYNMEHEKFYRRDPNSEEITEFTEDDFTNISEYILFV